MEFLFLLIPIAFVVGTIGLIVRLVLFALLVDRVVRQFQVDFATAVRNRPLPGQVLSAEWIREVEAARNTWSTMSALQQARRENDKAVLMGMVAQTGIRFP